MITPPHTAQDPHRFRLRQQEIDVAAFLELAQLQAAGAFSALPTDAVCRAVYLDVPTGTLLVLWSHPSFPEVSPDTAVPTLQEDR